jgi:hypothetical protein
VGSFSSEICKANAPDKMPVTRRPMWLPNGIGQARADNSLKTAVHGHKLFAICGLSTTYLAKMRQKSQRVEIYLGDSWETT